MGTLLREQQRNDASILANHLKERSETKKTEKKKGKEKEKKSERISSDKPLVNTWLHSQAFFKFWTLTRSFLVGIMLAFGMRFSDSTRYI